MLTLRNLIPVIDEFLIGDASNHKILPAESVALDEIIDARVDSITAKDNTPIIWLDIKHTSEDPLDFN